MCCTNRAATAALHTEAEMCMQAAADLRQQRASSSFSRDDTRLAGSGASTSFSHYTSSCLDDSYRPHMFHAALPPLRTQRSRANDDEDYFPAAELRSHAPTRAKRARTVSLVDEDFVAGNSPLNFICYAGHTPELHWHKQRPIGIGPLFFPAQL